MRSIQRTLLLVTCAISCLSMNVNATEKNAVTVELIEGIPDQNKWNFPKLPVTETYHVPEFGLATTPNKYSAKGHIIDRSNPFLVRMRGTVTLDKGKYRFLLRSRGAARLFVNDKLLTQTKFRRPNGSGHEKVPTRESDKLDTLYPLPAGHQHRIVTTALPKGKHQIRVEVFVGGKRMKNDIGELIVGIAAEGEAFTLLSSDSTIKLDGESWWQWTKKAKDRQQLANRQRRQEVTKAERAYWDKRHQLARKIWSKKPACDEANVIDHFIDTKLKKHKVKPAPLTNDLAFLRRITLDTVGTVPTLKEIQEYLHDDSDNRREKAIERLLNDDRWADHWVSYWQDALAENPGILKPMLNNTGPFRWWIYEALIDNVPMDRFATDAILMEGSTFGGGPAGFSMATQNDVPMAARAHVVAKTFLGLEMACARCHDAPHHPFLQEQTFQLAAMLAKKPLKVPSTSSVKVTERNRRPLIDITLKPGAVVKPHWPFTTLTKLQFEPGVLRDKSNSREQLAALITSPHNERFPQVMVNRLWKRLMGKGLVEPVDDWAGEEPSHPQLLQYLARELVMNDYDLKHVAKLIMQSSAYQRRGQAIPARYDDVGNPLRLFEAPYRRRLSAEQIIDSLFDVAGKSMDSEELTMDPEGRRPTKVMLTLGSPRRAWGFTSLSNERDRPALAMPKAQSIVDLLKAYGWRASRPNPISERDETATPLQPLMIANGTAARRITKLSDDSAFTELALADQSLESLIDDVFLRILTRKPTGKELTLFVDLLKEGYENRRPEGYENLKQKKQYYASAVSWSNHLHPDATRLKMEMEQRVRAGDPATKRLHKDWRERMEDMVWSLVNSPEFMFVP